MSVEYLGPPPGNCESAIKRLDIEVSQLIFVSPNKTPAGLTKEKMRLSDQIRSEFAVPPKYPQSYTNLPLNQSR